MKKFVLGTALALFGLTAVPSQAQLLLVTGDYRVTEIDQENQRFGVALPEARPDVTQNWVYVEPKTDIHRRVTNHEGWTKEEHLDYYQFFRHVKPGLMMKVHGGRRWDGAISSKTLWIGFPQDPR